MIIIILFYLVIQLIFDISMKLEPKNLAKIVKFCYNGNGGRQ